MHYDNVFVHKGGKLEKRQFLAKMHQIAPNCVSNSSRTPLATGLVVSTRCKQLLFVVCFCCRNLPLSIVISITAIFVLYVSANFSYFVVLGVDGVLQSEAVATVRSRQFVMLNCICEMDFVLVDCLTNFVCCHRCPMV